MGEIEFESGFDMWKMGKLPLILLKLFVKKWSEGRNFS
jgi:hypothetical protein